MLSRTVLDALKPRSRRSPAPGRVRRRPATYRPCLELLEDRFLPSTYLQTNLAADQPGVALVHDPELIDAWGISLNPNGTFCPPERPT